MNRYRRSAGHFIVFPLLCLMMTAGCASPSLDKARTAYYDRRSGEAAALLNAPKDISGRDRLLHLMEQGLILHDLGNYEESARVLLEAERWLESRQSIRISRQTASMVFNDWVTDYEGEYSERLWVHTWLMMNFLLTDRYESAGVEARKALTLMDEFPDAVSEDYFSRALAALCFENLGLINDAYIEYKKLAESLPDPAPLTPLLYRMALRLGFRDEQARLREQMPPGVRPEDAEAGKELVLFLAGGMGPKKVQGNIMLPPSIRFSFPQYRERNRGIRRVAVQSPAVRGPVFSVLSDINAVARASLQDRAARIMLKETARVTAKEAISQAVGRKNEGWVEVVLRAAFFLMETPDTRCWETLPATLMLLRIPLPENAREARLSIIGDVRRKTLRIPLAGRIPQDRGRIFRSYRLNP